MVSSMNTSTEFLAEDRGPSIIATASCMIFLCTTFVMLRYYSRYLTNTAFNIEDLIIPFAWVAEIGLCVVGISRWLHPLHMSPTYTQYSNGPRSGNGSSHGLYPLH
jgi:hypothetical protein